MSAATPDATSYHHRVEQLTRRQAEIIAAIRNHLALQGHSIHSMPNQHEFTDDDSIAGYFAEQEIAELTRELDELRDIQAARQRMEDGTYGVCTDCGETIAADRLSAHPTAKRCIACQRKREAHRHYITL